MPVTTTNLLGTYFGGRFRLDEALGAGAAASVFLATDMKQNCRAAVKILRSTAASALKTFRAEAQLAMSLDHPAIIRTYAADLTSPPLFLAMEYVEGSDLRTYINRFGPIVTVRSAYYIAGQVLLALAYIHDLGIVHNDVRPENVMIGYRSDRTMTTAKLNDFGLAYCLQSPSPIGQRRLAPSLYLAPERLMGRSCSPTTDLYAFGILLGEMVVGHSPLRTDIGLATEGANANRGALTEDIPPAFSGLLGRLLAPNPHVRFHQAQDVAPVLAGAFQQLQKLEERQSAATPKH